MKLAAIYNVWDGEELLKGSIKQIRSQVDLVIVVTQNLSNHGEYREPNISDCLELIDMQVHFEPIPKLRPMINETRKRQLGLDTAIDHGCTHFLLMDCDEYYDTGYFFAAKMVIKSNDYKATVVKMKTYYKNPEWQIDGFDDYYVPFICKIYPGIACGMFPQFPFYCDPTRKLNISSVVEIPTDTVFMHHYSWIRKDIMRKLNNSSAKINFESKISYLVDEYRTAKLGSEISWYNNRKLVEAQNYFGIESYSNTL